MIERPFEIIVKSRSIYFLERERNGPVIFIDISSFLVPIRTDDITIKSVNDPVYGGGDPDEPIANDSEHTLISDRPAYFPVESIKIKPMYGLCDGDEVKGIVWERSLFRGLHGVF